MKKQFFRVKQLADQTFSRADKTEVLSDDLQEADRRVECIRIACQNTSKKLVGCISGQAQEHDKRVKKVAEYMLGAVMQECVPGTTDDDFLLGKVLHICGKVEQELASDEVDYELDVEQKVITNLQSVLEKDVPNIMKHKRNLTKLTLDMDSAKTRYQAALKHSASNTGTARVESIKSELEDAEMKVEQCRDQLASEMFQLVSRESELAQTIVQFAKFQHEYHKAAMARLEMVIPALENDIVKSPHKPVYGVPLEEHLQVTERKIALPIELCVWALLELGMEEEGLFRVAGGASKLRRIKLSMDARCLAPQAILDYRDPHVIAGALKSYLRELPEPLMTYILYDDWMAAARVQNNEARLQALWQVVQKLPSDNYNNLRHLIRFLHVLSQNHEVNKMTPQNIAIVIAPNLIWGKASDSSPIGMNMNAANTYSLIVDNLVSFAEWFFPGDLDFYENYTRENTALVNGMSTSVGPVMTCEGLASSPPSGVTHGGHTRSSSGEGQLINLGDSGSIKRTQSSSSLSDHSSPPHGSPKPATRRKNKPAPIPPSNAVINREHLPDTPKSSEKPEKPPRPSVAPAITTLPRPSKKQMEHENKTTPAEHPKTASGAIGFEHFSTTTVAARRSLDLDHTPALQHQSGMEKSSSEIHKSTEEFSQGKSDTSQSVPTATPSLGSVTVTSGNIGKIVSVVSEPTVQKGNTGHPGKATIVSESIQQKSNPSGSVPASSLERRPQQRPVAAPRSIVNIGGGTPSPVPGKEMVECKVGEAAATTSKEADAPGLSTAAGSGGDAFSGVQLRRTSASASSDSGERLSKPIVPERPAALLRPHASSFRVSRLSSDSDNTTADKSSSESDRPMLERTHMYSVDKQQVSIIQVRGEREKTDSALQRSPSVGGGSRPFSMSPPGKSVSNEKPERPPKLEIMAHSERKEQRTPSHWRALSEGNIVDIDANQPGVRYMCTGINIPPQSPRLPSKPPRPIPPPPPPPSKHVAADSIVESTDL